MSELLNAQGLPVQSKITPIRALPRIRANGSKYCACGVKISHNAQMCLRCVKIRQLHHEDAIVAHLANLPEGKRKELLDRLPKGQADAFRMRIEEYLDDHAERFKPGR